MSNESQIGNTWLKIKPLVQADLGAIEKQYAYEVHNGVATFDTLTPDEEYWHQKLISSDNQSYPIWVARDSEANDGVMGWCGVSRFDPKQAYLRSAEFSFYVLNDYQGKGIGRLLMNHALTHLKNHPTIQTLISRIALQQEASMHLHRSLGFKHIGTLEDVGFKLGKPLSVALYQYHL